MAKSKKKVYKFSDEVMARDALISLIFGVLAMIIILGSIVYAFITKGNVPEYIGGLLLAGVVMTLTAFIFSLLSYRDSDGGILGKRVALIVSIIDGAALTALYLF